MCACCPVGLLQKCCCYSYHQSQEQIACQNKPSNFRRMGRQLSERMQLGCLFLSSVECLQIKFLFLERGSQRSEKLWRIITTAFTIQLYQPVYLSEHILKCTFPRVPAAANAESIINQLYSQPGGFRL